MARFILVYDRPRGVLFVLVVSALCVSLITALRRGSRGRDESEQPDSTKLLIAFLLSTAVASAATLALTALWNNHLELIALPATFATCLLASNLDAVQSRIRRLGAIVATAVVCIVAFGGVSFSSPSSPDFNRPLSDWWRTPGSASAVALDDAYAMVRDSGVAVTYARLGDNRDEAHAQFINKGLKLACPLFHQYEFSSNLDEALACIQRRQPELLLVGPSFGAHHVPKTKGWDRFVSDSRRLLHAHYVLALTNRHGGRTVEVWRRRDVTFSSTESG